MATKKKSKKMLVVVKSTKTAQSHDRERVRNEIKDLIKKLGIADEVGVFIANSEDKIDFIQL